MYGKVPPQAIELEQAVLGGILLQKTAFETVAEVFPNEQVFYVDAHQRIFRACKNLSQNSIPIDILTVVEALKATDELETVGGPYAITKMTNAVVSTANIEAWSRIILQKFIQRELIRFSGELITDAYEDSTDVFDLLDKAEENFYRLTTGHIKSNYQTAATLYMKSINQIEQLRNNPQELSGVPTGYPALDRITHGWQPTDLIILAARPSVGKTAFALNLARNAAMHPFKPTAVGMFSLEMSAGQLFSRIQSAESKINLDRILRGRLDDGHMQTLYKLSDRIEKMQLFIDDSSALNIFELRAKARRMVGKHNVGLIIIDYLQLMSGVDDSKTGNREQEISKISRSLKSLAKELKVPIIALSQLSRIIESRKGGEPQLSDLRESGAIEQDADFVGFLTRPDYQKQEGDIDPSEKNDAELKIKKNRNGVLESLAFKTDLGIQTWFDLEQYEKHHSGSNQFPASTGKWRPVNIDETTEDLPF